MSRLTGSTPPSALMRTPRGRSWTWGQRYPALNQLGRNSRTGFITFVDYDLKVRTRLCSRHAIESLSARVQLPTEQAA